jgi:hypothetical protein
MDEVEFGALQIATYYDCAIGDFVGERSSTRCTANLALNMATSFSDTVRDGTPCTGTGIPGLGNLAVGSYATAGETGPTILYTCIFQSNGSVPTAADFPIEVVDATDPQLAPIDVTVAITAVRPLTLP